MLGALASPALAVLLLARAASAQTPPEDRTRGGSYHWEEENTYAPGPIPYTQPRPPSAPPYTPPETPPTPEAPSARFGAPGQLVLSGDSNVGISSTAYTSSASYLAMTFSPVVDYFFLRNVSIGLSAGASYTDAKGYGADSSVVETKGTSFFAGPRFGWNIPLGGSFSWWILGTLGVEANHSTQSLVSGSTVSTSSSAGAPSTSQDGPYVQAYAPLLFHPVPHFYIGMGPSIFHEFARLQGGPDVGDERTSIGLGVTVGGYLGGSMKPAEGSAESAPPHETDAGESTSASNTTGTTGTSAPAPKRFGEQGQVLLTSALTASLNSTTYSGTSSSLLNGSLTLAGDYFFVDHVSLGMAVSASTYQSNGLDANGNVVTNSDTSGGVSFRVGGEIPLGAAVSLYPLGSIGFNAGNTSESSVAGSDAYAFSELWVGLYLPVVVRVAPHFIVGLGPSISHDLAETDTFSQNQQVSNPSTTVGAGLLVGGWL